MEGPWTQQESGLRPGDPACGALSSATSWSFQHTGKPDSGIGTGTTPQSLETSEPKAKQGETETN